jgi:hypothetical protein
MSSDVEQHVRWLNQHIELGVDVIFLHHVGRDQERVLQVFGEQVLTRIANSERRGRPFRYDGQARTRSTKRLAPLGTAGRTG